MKSKKSILFAAIFSLVISLPVFARSSKKPLKDICRPSIKKAGLATVEEQYGSGIYSADEASLVDDKYLKNSKTRVTLIRFWSPFDVPEVYVITTKSCVVTGTVLVN